MSARTWPFAIGLTALLGGCGSTPTFDRSSAARTTEVSELSNTTGPNDGRIEAPPPITGDEAGQSMRSAASRPMAR